MHSNACRMPHLSTATYLHLAKRIALKRGATRDSELAADAILA